MYGLCFTFASCIEETQDHTLTITTLAYVLMIFQIKRKYVPTAMMVQIQIIKT